MHRKLVVLEKVLKNRDQEKIISVELYDLLIKEKERINNLAMLVERGRGSSFLRVLSWEIISEQTEEFVINEKWISKEMISAIREFITAQKDNEPYDWNISEDDVKRTLKTIRRILNNWQEIAKRLDVFEKRNKWSIAVYDIKKDCYPNELFKSIGINNDNEAIQELSNSTMNLLQIDWLYKNGKLDKNLWYHIFVMIDHKIILLSIGLGYEHKFYWNNYWWIVKKGNKLLIFTPLNLEQ